MSTNARYVDILTDADVLTVAAHLDFEVRESNGASPGSFGPCPACGSVNRHGEGGHHGRLACGVTADGKGWQCHDCHETGDAMNIVCFNKTGKKGLREAGHNGRGLIAKFAFDMIGADMPAARPRLHVVREQKPRPPLELLQELWAECGRVDEDEEVCAWLAARKISTTKVADQDLARALPRDSSAAWKWAQDGYRLLTPMRDPATDEIANFRARPVGETFGAKSLTMTGYRASGLSFFDPAALDADEVFFVEGEKKFLQMASSSGAGISVVGVGSGLHCPELIARISQDATVYLMLDNDSHGTGAKYATEIIQMLSDAQRAKMRLWKGLKVTSVDGRKRVVNA